MGNQSHKFVNVSFKEIPAIKNFLYHDKTLGKAKSIVNCHIDYYGLLFTIRNKEYINK